MTTICAKCRHVRPLNATVPSWQCPSCGVAYVKAGDSSGATAAVRHASVAPLRASSGPGLPWRKIAFGAAIVLGVVAGHQASRDHRNSASGLVASAGARVNSGMSDSDIAVLAKSVRAGDVTMYTTTDCPYCAQARGWLTSHGFAFSECDAETTRSCADELASRGAKGVPFLVVRGRAMDEGFDAGDFLAALAKR